jgi:hypothetical protein
VKPSTDWTLSHERLVSTGTADVQTATLPRGTSHITISVETTSARVTFSGQTPSAILGHVYPADAPPIFIPLGQGTVIKFVSTAATSSVVQLGYHQ